MPWIVSSSVSNKLNSEFGSQARAAFFRQRASHREWDSAAERGARRWMNTGMAEG
jgi:hypothetical protein